METNLLKTTITDDQIRDLAKKAQAEDPTDYHQIDLCARALTADGDTTNDDGHEIAFADWTQAQARAECARVIADAAAQE